MIYQTSKFLCTAVLKILRRWQIQGLGNLPAKGGFLIVSNHTSYWDPLAVGCAIKPRIYYMAKAELFKIPVFRELITSFGAFPVHREKADRQAIRMALKLLKEGKVVGIFPEGTRSHSGELLQPHLGAAMLALKSQVPVVPVAVLDSKGIFRRLKLNIGKPFYIGNRQSDQTPKEIIEAGTEQIMSEISHLMQLK
ncbi:1-acyl-sn-glycerol-3-phosphate acyltransferase [Desulfofarcimen acetoxidans DSM 771]|jgi:1-acyl-sn-glycerol-3-phosphate acyltransferase|uniref:1-acyl-sn-glycerol-3-phosphate acyltransferase n=1 Tax=Desulfofarcimen acetoxidans (strain ATCC 49208 / DSM 771 / KCTC 5769 / VKM B-1644 / 5575) TaxID=485916 RepID=C8VZ20_DESAS|nr:lysophospholipid acyltransferase family protein [Desulfofarcimen acetoxidans]ACV62930.1 1-acyl-sn-glycerol-3-phosphate acyltransferase [Desulfofarcimen acetoxidans DSM 771]